jgi:hypothetical protein
MATTNPVSNSKESSERIRQQVDDRHWQLFETRLKNQLPDINKENYTKSNDYRVINRLKKIDHPQTPIEPNRRWEIFCSQLTSKSNETDRLMSIFHDVWNKNWNIKQTYEIPKADVNVTILNKKTFINHLSIDEHDRKVISSILHQNL